MQVEFGITLGSGVVSPTSFPMVHDFHMNNVPRRGRRSSNPLASRVVCRAVLPRHPFRVLPALEHRRRLVETPLKRLGQLLDDKAIVTLSIQKEYTGFQMHMGGC